MPERPLVVAFDMVETLFPLDPLGERLARAGQSPDLLPIWFGQLLRDAFALTVSGGYRPFAEVAIAALRTLTPLSQATAQEVVGGFAELDPHPDLGEAMKLLQAASIRIITLTNGSVDTTSTLLERAGVRGLVEHVVSVEAVRRWSDLFDPPDVTGPDLVSVARSLAALTPS